jgi:hypothetical protein
MGSHNAYNNVKILFKNKDYIRYDKIRVVKSLFYHRQYNHSYQNFNTVLNLM